MSSTSGFMKLLSFKEISAAIGVAGIFLLASYGSDRFAGIVESYLGDGGVLSVFAYILTLVSIIMIPFASTLPIIPIAVSLWGNIIAAALTWCGWMIGATVTFSLARYIGVKYVERLPLLKHVHAFGAMIPRKNFYWGTVALGIIGAPIDIMSYAFGFLSPFSAWTYLRAIAIGLIPFAFFITYTATLSLKYQTYALTLLIFVWFGMYIYMRQRPRATGGQNSNNG